MLSLLDSVVIIFAASILAAAVFVHAYVHLSNGRIVMHEVLAKLQEASDKIRNEKTVVGSVHALIGAFKDQIVALKAQISDGVTAEQLLASVQEIEDGIDQNTAALTGDVVANTPAAPTT